MKKLLEDIKVNGETAVFLLPSAPVPITGTIASLSTTKVVIENQINDDIYQYATHPNNVVLVTKKPRES